MSRENNKYIVKIEKEEDKLEAYEEEGKNIILASMQLPSGEWISDPNSRIHLNLSPEGLLGLGTELIRTYFKVKHGKKVPADHLTPSQKGSIYQQYGVCIHPESCEILLSVYDIGKIDDLTNASATETEKSFLKKKD